MLLHLLLGKVESVFEIPQPVVASHYTFHCMTFRLCIHPRWGAVSIGRLGSYMSINTRQQDWSWIFSPHCTRCRQDTTTSIPQMFKVADFWLKQYKLLNRNKQKPQRITLNSLHFQVLSLGHAGFWSLAKVFIPILNLCLTCSQYNIQ